jgi:hypothetical protein
MNTLSEILSALMKQREANLYLLRKRRSSRSGTAAAFLKKWNPKVKVLKWIVLRLCLYFFFEDAAASLVRCLPGEDATNGFFVSCFIRDLHLTQKRKLNLTGDDAELQPEPPLKRKKKKKGKKKASTE